MVPLSETQTAAQRVCVCASTRQELTHGEEGPNVYVETEVREAGRDDLVAAIVPVLPDLGHQHPRATPLLLLKLLPREGGGQCHSG